MAMSPEIRGPAVPTAASHAAQRPFGIDDVEITGGPLGRRQRLNRTASIPPGLVQMQRSGVPNLRLAAGQTHPRVDAVRGCAAVERGPLVYCFEQIDQTGELDELRLQATGRTERDPQGWPHRVDRSRPRHRRPVLAMGQPRRRRDAGLAAHRTP